MGAENSSAVDFDKGYAKALALLHACVTPDGFVASSSGHDNYWRVWSRDGTIISLAALLARDSELIETARKTFETLAEYQGPHGEIPSNVDTVAQRIGAMVDGAIVMMENAYKNLAKASDEKDRPLTTEERWVTISQCSREVGPAFLFSCLQLRCRFYQSLLCRTKRAGCLVPLPSRPPLQWQPQPYCQLHWSR